MKKRKVSYNFDSELWKKLKYLSADTNISMTSLIHEAVENWVSHKDGMEWTTKRTINFDDDLWNDLEIISLIKYGKSGSVKRLLHESAENYLSKLSTPEEYEMVKKILSNEPELNNSQ